MVKRFWLIFLGLAFSNFCFASTISVLPQGQYQTIQAAVDAADAGDTILVGPGIYRENVDIYQRPKLVLKADKSNLENATSTDVIIEAADPGKPIIKLSYARAAVIDGFILRGAVGSAGISLGYIAENIKVANNIIESNKDGIYIDYSAADSNEITGNIFRGNSNSDIDLPAQFCWPSGMLCQSKDNLIYFNDFYGPPLPGSSPYVNYWSSKEDKGYVYKNQSRIGKLGNYWAQCGAADADGDGIGDAPCNINQLNYDRYPLVEPFNNYEIIQPEIISGDQEWDQSRAIDKPVIIIAGSKLTVKKGITLNVQSRGAIIVDGELAIKGTVKNPVKLVGVNGYSGKLVSIRNTGSADLRNVEIIASMVDGLPPRQTAVAVTGAGKLEMQSCRVSGNAAGVELNQTLGANIKINRSKFSNNLVDAANNNPADSAASDFKYNWWADARITGNIDSSSRAAANFRDPVILVPGIVGSWPENGILKIDPILHSFDGLIDQLEAAGYVKGVDLFEFPYEWRNRNEDSARSLAALVWKIKTDTKMPKVDIIAHSMGGLVARQYIESDYYQNDVDQLITLATPNNGSPQSYLTYEGGDVGPNILESLFKSVFVHEAKERHYPDVLLYVHGRVLSVAQLLPIYNYLYEGNTNFLRFYPNGYPQNSFLENLNLAENIKKMATVEYDKIVAELSNSQSTINGFKVEASTQLPKWIHGYPIDYDNPFSRDAGLVKGVGDNVVPLISAQSFNIQSDELTTLVSDHASIMSIGRRDILELLTGVRPQGVEIDWRIPNVMIVQVFSPVDIQIVAPDGKWIGKNITNLPENNKIAEAYYTGADADAEFATIPDPIGDYKIITQSTGTGEFSVETTMISQNSETQQVQETSATIQGNAVLNQQEQFGITVDGSQVVIEENDIIAPAIVITSPQNDSSYLNSGFLAVSYTVSDNKSAPDKIITKVFLDGVNISADQIDLAFQKTGTHLIKIETQDEAGNTSSKEVGFKVSATIDSIAANVKKFAGLGLIKKPQNIVMAAQMKALQAQFDVLSKLKADKKLPAKARTVAVKALEAVINRQIDLLIREIQKASGKGIDIKIVNLLVDSLKYIKIK